MSKRTTIACIALLATTLWACDDGEAEMDAGMDAGGGEEDAGTTPDSGGGDEDAGTDAGEPDAGPPQTFTARLVNDIPGYAAVEVCMWVSVGGTIVPADTPGTLLTAGDLVVPFRGVSSYISDPLFIVSPTVDYVVALYDAAGFGGTCPNDPNATGAPDAALIGTIAGTDLTVGGTYSIIAAGLDEGTLGAADGELPSLCDPAMGFTQPCTAATASQLLLVEDDLTDPATDMARLRIANMVPNVGPLAFMVCYDAELVPHPDSAMAARGACVESATLVDPVPLTAAPVSYGTVTDYTERDPIQPTLPGIPPGVGGGLYLAAVPPTATNCPTFDTLTVPRCLPILGAFPMPPGDDHIQPNLEAGDVATIFIQGALGVTEDTDPTVEDYRVKLFIWQDNLVTP